MLILKENVADKKKRSFFKITKSVNYFWSDMKDAKNSLKNDNVGTDVVLPILYQTY
jgi:hypothetical protein